MTKEEIEKLKQTVAYFGHWYDVIGEERVILLEKSIEYIAELENENAELKNKLENLRKYLDTQNSYRECAETWEKLSEAKGLLQKLVDISEKTYPDDSAFDVDFEELLRETEQFLNLKEENKGNE